MITIGRIPEIAAGNGSSRELAAHAGRLLRTRGATAVIITGSSSFDRNVLSADILRSFVEADFTILRLRVAGEPSPETVDGFTEEIRPLCRGGNAPVVVAIGGGSVMDAAKATAACATMDQPAWRYLEGVGDLQPAGTRLPLIAVPTTSGTGSEATMNSVLSRTGEHGFKKSMRHPAFIPDIAVFDPLLLDGAGYETTAASGWDAVTQLLEAAVSTKANGMTDLYSFAGLHEAAEAFPAVCSAADRRVSPEPEERCRLRLRMAEAAFYGGVALANAGLGFVHGAASPLGAIADAPHGVICGLLLPGVTRALTGALLKNEAREAAARYAAAGYILSGKAGGREEAMRMAQGAAGTADGCRMLNALLEEWKERFPLPGLSHYGIRREDLAEAARRSSRKNSPADIPESTLIRIFEEAL